MAIDLPGTAATGVNCGAAAALNATSFTIYAKTIRDGAGNTASTGTGGHTAIEPVFFRLVGQADGSNLDGNYCLGYIPASNKWGADFEDFNTGLNHPFTFTTAESPTTGPMDAAVTYDGGASDPGVWVGYSSITGMAANGTLNVSSATANVRRPRDDSIQQVGIGVAINSTGTRTGGWNGHIIEIGFWKNKVLTAAQIKAIYDSKLKGFMRQIEPGSLTAHYMFDETADGATVSTSAGIIRDSVGTNHGTAFGTITARADTINSRY